MKKVFRYLILLIISLFAFNVYAANVEISSVEVFSKTDYIEELSSPSIDGTNIDFNLRFKDEEQKIVYKIVLKNNTKADLVLDSSFDNNIIKYNLLDFDDNTVKANDSRTIYLQLYYIDEIDENLYNNNVYTASSTFKFTLSGNYSGIKGVLENPKTGVFTYSILIVSLIVLMTILFIRVRRLRQFKYYVLAILLLVPAIVFADNFFNATVDGNTNMEFVEPKRAIFDIGHNVNDKMHEMAGDIMPGYAQDPSTGYTVYQHGDPTHIRHIRRADSLNSNNAQEVQADNSDYKIWMWYDNGVIYYYSDEALIY